MLWCQWSNWFYTPLALLS